MSGAHVDVGHGMPMKAGGCTMRRKLLLVVLALSLIVAVVTAVAASSGTASAGGKNIEKGGPNTFWD
jgi:hypothetical protein